jgi:wyosine [tRNA(Phe)-imidazoG37] synthetase (radical SAM superfamily)
VGNPHTVTGTGLFPFAVYYISQTLTSRIGSERCFYCWSGSTSDQKNKKEKERIVSLKKKKTEWTKVLNEIKNY